MISGGQTNLSNLLFNVFADLNETTDKSSGIPIETAVRKLEDSISRYKKHIYQTKNNLVIAKMRKLAKEIEKKDPIRGPRIARGLEYGAEFVWEDIFYEGLRTKIDRAKALLGLDESLAQTYFRYGPLDTAEGGYVEEVGPAKINLKHIIDGFLTFIRLDNELYQSILNRFQVKEEPRPQTEQVIISEIGPPAPVQEFHPIIKREPRVYTLRDLTNGTKPRHPSNEVSTSVRKFLNNVVNNEKYDAGFRQDVAHLIQGSKWYEHSLPPEKVTGFFNEMTKYVEAGKRPRLSEVRKMLQ